MCLETTASLLTVNELLIMGSERNGNSPGEIEKPPLQTVSTGIPFPLYATTLQDSRRSCRNKEIGHVIFKSDES